MHFILAPGCIVKFDNLRKTYEAEKKVNLSEKQSIIGTPIFLEELMLSVETNKFHF